MVNLFNGRSDIIVNDLDGLCPAVAHHCVH
jgi:hypothetical protein